MGIAGGYLAKKVRSCPPVFSVPSGQTGILSGRGLSMRSLRYGRLGCPGEPLGGGVLTAPPPPPSSLNLGAPQLPLRPYTARQDAARRAAGPFPSRRRSRRRGTARGGKEAAKGAEAHDVTPSSGRVSSRSLLPQREQRPFSSKPGCSLGHRNLLAGTSARSAQVWEQYVLRNPPSPGCPFKSSSHPEKIVFTRRPCWAATRGPLSRPRLLRLPSPHVRRGGMPRAAARMPRSEAATLGSRNSW